MSLEPEEVGHLFVSQLGLDLSANPNPNPFNHIP